jgi:hypothetical protein
MLREEKAVNREFKDTIRTSQSKAVSSEYEKKLFQALSIVTIGLLFAVAFLGK